MRNSGKHGENFFKHYLIGEKKKQKKRRNFEWCPLRTFYENYWKFQEIYVKWSGNMKDNLRKF